MSGFLIYYTVTGAIMVIVCAVNYKNMCEQDNALGAVVRYTGRDLFLIINFFAGFLNAPICIPLLIKSYFLRRKLKRLQEENERLTKATEDLREAIRKQDELNEKIKNNEL